MNSNIFLNIIFIIHPVDPHVDQYAAMVWDPHGYQGLTTTLENIIMLRLACTHALRACNVYLYCETTSITKFDTPSTLILISF